MKLIKRSIQILLSIVSLSLSGVVEIHEASAQAYCALRQPHRAQQELFPTSTSQQAFMNQVTSEHRAIIQRNLNFSIHQNELGLHTLYALFDGKKHLGFIHVRSEKGEWGLIEIAWALYPDLRVKGFIFQRCREFSREEIESDTFKQFINGMTGAGLRSYLSERGDRLIKQLPNLSVEAQPLGLRLFRSALKTIAVTNVVWPERVAPYTPRK